MVSQNYYTVAGNQWESFWDLINISHCMTLINIHISLHHRDDDDDALKQWFFIATDGSQI